jgi:hypothetical protein
MRKYHVEDPQDLENEVVFFEEELGYYTMFIIALSPKEEVKFWKMNFDGKNSQAGMEASIVFTSP